MKTATIYSISCLSGPDDNGVTYSFNDIAAYERCLAWALTQDLFDVKTWTC